MIEIQKTSKRPTRKYIDGFSENTLPKVFGYTVLFLLIAAALMFMLNRALEKNQENYCRLYPKAVYCKINP